MSAAASTPLPETETMPDAIVSMACLAQKLLDYLFGLGVVALAEMMGANATLGVDEVMRGPVFVVEARQIA